MQKTIISWTDFSWNPAAGCSKVSDGCRFCYAETQAARYRKDAPPWTVGNEAVNVVIKPAKLVEPYRLKEPSKVFVNSTSDAHHRVIPHWFRAAMFAVMLDLSQHVFQVLTKRAEALPDWADAFRAAVWSVEYQALIDAPQMDKRVRAALIKAQNASTPWGANVWQGASIEDRRTLIRLDGLKACGAAVKFISAEPLLEDWGDVDLTGIDQVLVGGESGLHMTRHPNRWMKQEWAREIRDLCIRDGAAFFYKQGSGLYTERDPQLRHEDDLRWQWHQHPGARHAPIVQFVAPRLYVIPGDWCALPYDASGVASDNTDACAALELDAYPAGAAPALKALSFAGLVPGTNALAVGDVLVYRELLRNGSMDAHYRYNGRHPDNTVGSWSVKDLLLGDRFDLIGAEEVRRALDNGEPPYAAAQLIGIVLTVGLTGGVGGALLIIRAARQNEAITYAMERLYLSTPPATQEQIRRIVELVVEGGGLLEDVTDGEFAAESGLEQAKRE